MGSRGTRKATSDEYLNIPTQENVDTWLFKFSRYFWANRSSGFNPIPHTYHNANTGQVGIINSSIGRMPSLTRAQQLCVVVAWNKVLYAVTRIVLISASTNLHPYISVFDNPCPTTSRTTKPYHIWIGFECKVILLTRRNIKRRI